MGQTAQSSAMLLPSPAPLCLHTENHLLPDLPFFIALPAQKSGALGFLDTWVLKPHLYGTLVLSTTVMVCDPHRPSRVIQSQEAPRAEVHTIHVVQSLPDYR